MPSTPHRLQRSALAVTKIAGLVLLLIAANHAFDQIRSAFEFDIRPTNEEMVHRAIMLAALLYAVSLAFPFVPGVEIGLGLMAVFGVEIVPLVYFCTVAGLTLAYTVGRLIPPAMLERLLRDLHLVRAAGLMARVNQTPRQDLPELLFTALSNGPARWLIRYRYLALGLAFNIPGNFIIGGGGGIALLAGISRLFSPHWFLLTVAIAVSPVPLAILVFGPAILAR